MAVGKPVIAENVPRLISFRCSEISVSNVCVCGHSDVSGGSDDMKSGSSVQFRENVAVREVCKNTAV